MNIRIFFGSSAVAVTVAALLSASPAAAAELTGADIACRAKVAKAYAKLMKTAVKTVTACHKSRDKDAAMAGTDCNNLAAADAEKGKFASAVTKTGEGLTKSCGVLLTAGSNSGSEWYISCPVTCPGADAEIPGEPMTTMEQVAACHACLITGIVEDVAAATLGSPTPPLSDGNLACHSAIAKNYGKLMDTEIKAETSCQKSADGDGGDGQYAACADNDEKGKVADTILKAGVALTDACGAATLADLGGCATDTVPNLKACTEAAWLAAEDEAYPGIYEHPALTCPNTIRTTVRAGCSVDGTDPGTCSNGHETGTQLSLGWKGMAHGVDTVDHFTLAGNIDCPGTPGACGECTITGISRDNEQYEDFTRCLSDTAIKCDNPFGTDPVCPGSQTCRSYLGPPLAVSVGLTPTCSVNIISDDITGSVDPDAGTSSFLVNLRAKVHAGEAQQRPCPICINDTVAQDGIRNGTCLGGTLHPGDPCDVQGFDLTFAPTNADNPVNGPSLDCPPDNGANISGQGLKIALPLTTGMSTKAGADACDPPNGSLTCSCGVCSGDTTEPCETDAYCASIGAGVCGTTDVPRNPNNCSDGICTDIGATDRGKCDTNIDTTCEGLLFANGKGILPCGDDSSCDAYISGSEDPWDWVCQDNDCGTCTHQAYRSCFLDPIVAQGTPSTTNPILVGTFCLPPSSNGSVNETTGSPGPAVVKTNSLAELRY